VAARRPNPRRTYAGVLVLALVIALGACSRVSSSRSAATTTTTESSRSSDPTPSTPLSAPKSSFGQDTKYFTDVTEADPALVAYEQKQGNVALRALLTDGSAFCALLKRGGGIDTALVAEAVGAKSTESQTHLPLSVTTFNTIEAVALLTLCPSEQKRLPASDRAKIRQLGERLSKRSDTNRSG
jgi:hypothetical protein